MRSLRVWSRVLGCQDAVLESVRFDEDEDAVVLSVRARVRASRRCGRCRRRCPVYDRGRGRRRWRMPDVAATRAFVEAELPRVSCPEHGVITAAVPWARHGVGHTHAFDAEVAWLVRQMSKSAVRVLLRIAWRTVGEIIARVVADADALAGDRLTGLRRIGIDEISYRRGHKYLTVVIDHDTGRLVWIGEGRNKATLVQFFDLLGPQRCAQIALVSADGAEWIFVGVGRVLPQRPPVPGPVPCRRLVRQGPRRGPRARSGAKPAATARKPSPTRSKAPGTRCGRTRPTSPNASRPNSPTSPRPTSRSTAPTCSTNSSGRSSRPAAQERVELLDEWLAWASRSNLTPFIDLARRIRVHFRPDIVHTLIYRLSNGRIESVNTKIRLLTRIAFGFKSVHALTALVRLHLGGYDTPLPGRT